MATSSFTAASFRGFKSDSGYTTLYTGFYNTNTTSYSKWTHAYRGMVFFDKAAISSALENKVADQIQIRITPINATRYNTSANWYFWRTDLSSMPADTTNVLGGLDSDRVGTHFQEELTKVTFTKADGQQTGVIATGEDAIRLADSLKAGYGLGLLNWYAENGATIYCPDEGLQHGGTTTDPVLIITHHDAGSAYVRSGGVWCLAMPYTRVSGVWHQAVMHRRIGGVWKQGIP